MVSGNVMHINRSVADVPSMEATGDVVVPIKSGSKLNSWLLGDTP